MQGERNLTRGAVPGGTALAPTVMAVMVVLPLAAVVLTVVLMGPRGYLQQSLDVPGLLTSLASAMLEALAALAGALTVGYLAYAALVREKAGKSRVGVPRTQLALARTTSRVWLLSALLLIPVDAADASGQPLGALWKPGGLSALVSGSYLPQAWVVVAVLVGVVALGVSWRVAQVRERRWPAVAGLLALALVATLPPVVVTQVLVGPNHDQGSDAATLGTPAAALAFGAVFVAVRRIQARQGAAPTARRRLATLLTTCLGIVLAADVVVGLFEIWPFPPASSPTAWLFAGRLLILALALVITLRWRRSLAESDTRGAAVEHGPDGRTLTRLALLLSAYTGMALAMVRIPPPQYFVPTTIQQNFLGYDVNLAPTLARIVFDWRLNLLFLVLGVTASVIYLVGVRRLRGRGDRWPAGRSVAWLSGWALIVFTTSSGLGRYSNALISMHMLLHMSLNMFGPLLLCLGAPLTLALRATHPTRRGEPPGPREWITSVMESRFAAFMFHPAHALIAFVSSYYILYFTPLFDYAMRYHWAHQVMNLEFVLVGYLFYSVIIGVDRQPREVPHIARLGLLFAAMPFHAFFGVVIMTTSTVIANTYFSYLQIPWSPDLAADQYLAGGIAWAAGEVPLAIVVIALLVQWSRADARARTRSDRHFDAGLDDSFDDYNALLARLSRSGGATTTNVSTSTDGRSP